MNIRIVRESGGLGDIVRVIPALRGLREKYPSARLWMFAPEEYRPVLEGWFDTFCPTPFHDRRPRNAPLDESRWPYLRAPGVAFDLDIDLYCPAFKHEVDCKGELLLDRIELFCAAAEVTPSDMTPRMNLRAEDISAARDYIAAHRLRAGRRRLIALQPFSTDPARNWPRANWLALSDRLEAEGDRVLVLDGCTGRTRCFRAHRVVGKPIGFVAALLAQCDLLIAPDSGLGHLAAAVGAPCLGLFASQPGAVMYKHYPLHRALEPDRSPDDPCRWPCVWRRPPQCQRAALLSQNRTCAMLARISLDRIIATAAVHGRSVA